MRAEDLEQQLHRLGWAFLLGLFLRIEFDGRSLLAPIFATACLVFLLRLRSYRAMSRSPWFDATLVAAAVVVATSAVALVPVVSPGLPSILAAVVTMIGQATYAATIRDWCGRQQWEPPIAKATSAIRWSVATAVLLAGGTLALVLFGDTGPDPVDGTGVVSVLGHPVDGTAAQVGFVVTALMGLVALLRLRGMSKLIHHSLRSQPDAELVAA